MIYPTTHTDKSSPYYANVVIKGVPYWNGQTRGILRLLIGQGGDCGLDRSLCLDSLLDLGLVTVATPYAGSVYRVTSKGRDYFADIWGC